MSASLKAIPGGQPSTTQPIAGPWLSPNEVTQKSLPKVLPDMKKEAEKGTAQFNIGVSSLPGMFMVRKVDPDKVKDPSPEFRTGPGGLTMRELHEKVKQSRLRDQAAHKARNPLVHPQNRWQRLVRYVWGRKKG
jgi:hypothetical protein